jgi:hypothetical protein
MTNAATKEVVMSSNLIPEKALNGDVCTFFLHAIMSWQDGPREWATNYEW